MTATQQETVQIGSRVYRVERQAISKHLRASGVRNIFILTGPKGGISYVQDYGPTFALNILGNLREVTRSDLVSLGVEEAR